MPNPNDSDEFLGLVKLCQSQLYGYLYALLHNMADTEDVLQNTIVVLWRKFAQFEPGTNFLHWAMRTARFEALKFQRTQRRDRRFFSEELLDLTDASFISADQQLEAERRAALTGCLQKLNENDRWLLERCYETGTTITSVAARLGRSAQSVCNSLRRIRQSLFECIERTLAHEEKRA